MTDPPVQRSLAGGFRAFVRRYAYSTESLLVTTTLLLLGGMALEFHGPCRAEYAFARSGALAILLGIAVAPSEHARRMDQTMDEHQRQLAVGLTAMQVLEARYGEIEAKVKTRTLDLGNSNFSRTPAR